MYPTKSGAKPSRPSSSHGPGTTVDTDELIALVKQQKGSHHAPKSIDLVDAIPLSAVGKPDKKAIRARYWAGTGRFVN